MPMQKFQSQVEINSSAESVFRWHDNPGAFERLMPPWEPVEILERDEGITNGTRIKFNIPLPFTKWTWVAEHQNYEAGKQFEDVQLDGPFKSWRHRHEFEMINTEVSRLIDTIQYQIPYPPIGKWIVGRMLRNKLKRMFRYRHALTKADCEMHAAYQNQPRLKVLMTGGTGLVGRALTAMLTTGGHQVTVLTRNRNLAGEQGSARFWDPSAGELNRYDLEQQDVIIHLSGENIAGQCWTPEFKERIRDSRVQSTKLLSAVIPTLTHKPKLFLSASAVGFYGNRGEEMLTEKNGPGEGFLPRICQEWEEAAAPIRQAGIRTVHARLGTVITPLGGALQKMLLPFRLGGGGPVGNGKQFWSCISLDDTIASLHHIMQTDTIEGPVNLTCPNPIPMKEFAAQLGRVLSRPAFVPLPKFAVGLMLGEMGTTLLCDSTRAFPTVLEQTGYQFRHPSVEQMIRFSLGRG